MTFAHERRAALVVTLLHPADRRWMLRNMPQPMSARLRALMRHPTVRAAVRAGIGPGELASSPTAVVPPQAAANTWLDDHVRGWHDDWVRLLLDDAALPAALAASVREYRAQAAREAA